MKLVRKSTLTKYLGQVPEQARKIRGIPVYLVSNETYQQIIEIRNTEIARQASQAYAELCRQGAMNHPVDPQLARFARSPRPYNPN